MVLTYASYLADQGHEVVLETNRIDTVFSINPKIKISFMTLGGQLGTILLALLKKRGSDIVIADIIPLAVALSIRNGRRVIYFAQDNNVTHYNNPVMRSLVVLLNYIGLFMFGIKTITVSEELSSILSTKYRAHISGIIPNGVDTAVFYPAPSHALAAEKENRRAILVLSRSDPRKGFAVVQEVVKKVRSLSAFPLEIWTVGEPSEGIFPTISHRDFRFVREERLRELFSSADLFLYPSFSEGYGLMVIEAFACRCPVVTTEAVHFAVHEHNALVSKIGDVDSLASHVCRLLESSELAHTITSNGYTFAHAHALEQAKGTFESVLKNFSLNHLGN